uniref:Uncharacterized protein LOC105119719 n=1 Tax=Rhizophora mucronata TaxID=61149 RepID=A0A2P2NPI6_RHIMU
MCGLLKVIVRHMPNNN